MISGQNDKSLAGGLERTTRPLPTEKQSDPGRIPRVTRASGLTGSRILRACEGASLPQNPNASPGLVRNQEGWMLNDPEPNVEQTEACSAICVQSVDAHMSCSSHSDAQLAAFFIDPRAK